MFKDAAQGTPVSKGQELEISLCQGSYLKQWEIIKCLHNWTSHWLFGE